MFPKRVIVKRENNRNLSIKKEVGLILIVQMDTVEKSWPATWGFLVQLNVGQISASCSRFSNLGTLVFCF